MDHEIKISETLYSILKRGESDYKMCIKLLLQFAIEKEKDAEKAMFFLHDLKVPFKVWTTSSGELMAWDNRLNVITP